MKKPLEKEYEYYKEIRQKLAREHRGKLVAIKGRAVLGIFADTSRLLTLSTSNMNMAPYSCKSSAATTSSFLP